MAMGARELARIVAKAKRSVRRGHDQDARHEIEMVPLLDIVTNIMLFLLATIATTFTATIHVPAPSSRPLAEPVHEERLTVTIGANGYVVATDVGFLQSDCTRFGPFAMTVPSVGGVTDPSALTRCLRTLHAMPGMAARFPSTRPVQLAGAGNVEYTDVIAALDAIRGNHQDLFPNVRLGVER